MSRADWYGFHVDIAPIVTAEDLQAALADPEQRWYAMRRLSALAASGAITAAIWQEHLHPRGRDGKFIEKFGFVRWLGSDLQWRHGQVRDISADGTIDVRSPDGNWYSFQGGSKLYSRPKPKARLALPNVVTGKIPDKWKKIGGQGGSNPGGVFQMEGSYAGSSPDIGRRNQLFRALDEIRQSGTNSQFLSTMEAGNPAESFLPDNLDVVVVPRLDGTAGRYDVLQKIGGKWYRVPESGSMTVDDLAKPDLLVTPEQAFGAAWSARRDRVVADLGGVGVVRSSEFDVEDVASMVQQTASPLPQVGDQFYVKTMNLPERARNEALANEIYELLGVPVPDVAVGEDGVTISSKIVPNTVPFDKSNPAHVKAAQEAFIADAFLANWDVVGLTFDNIRFDQEGRPWRIDAGGALLYRAQGSPKGANFGTNVGEIQSLRNSGLNPNAAKVFGGLSKNEMVEQAKLLQAITPSDLHALAVAHDLPDLGPVLVARRKSVLDQLGIPDPPPQDIPNDLGVTPTSLKTPKAVFNPVEAVQQMGTPPTVAVKNWAQIYDGLKTATLDSWDWSSPTFASSAIFKGDSVGGLWVYESNMELQGAGKRRFEARNLLTGELRNLVVTDGKTEYLFDYANDIDGNNGTVDQLVDQLQMARDLAVAEYVARADGKSITQLNDEGMTQAGDPPDMAYFWQGLPTWAALQKAVDFNRFGPDNDRPLYDSNGDLWHPIELPSAGNDMIVLERRTGPGAGLETMTLDPESWITADGAPFFMPGTDVTAAVAKSKYVQTDDIDVEAAKKAAEEKAQIDALLNPPDVDDGPSLPDAEQDHMEGGDKFDPANPDTWHLATDDEFNKAFDDGSMSSDDIKDALAAQQPDTELEALIAKEEAIAQQMADAADTGPGSSKKIAQNLVDGLGAGEPTLSSEWAASDVDDLKAKFEGKSVAVLPADAHDNPDWDGKGLSVVAGLGTVKEVKVGEVKFGGGYVNGVWKAPHYENVVRMQVVWPDGTGTWINGSDDAKFPKSIVPIDTVPEPQQVTFKTNGQIVVNGEVVGSYMKGYAGSYVVVIDGKHSITGKPAEINAKKVAWAKASAGKMVVPIAPKVTKAKTSKVTATEDEIKALNLQLAYTEVAIEDIQAQLDALANVQPVGGEGTTELPDGSFVGKGDWVFSTKDGVFAQIKQVDPKLGPKHTGLVNNYVKVAIPQPQPDGSTKWKWTNRPKENLVAAAAPGETPFVMQTKALKDSSGHYWIGPGVQVALHSGGAGGQKALVVDTTVDGKVKYQWSDGTQHWTTAENVFVHALADVPTLKTPAGMSTADADDLNAQLAALQDEKQNLATQIAQAVLPGPPKKKKAVGTPYPGPNGKQIIQPKSMAEEREAKGLKNMKDGLVPTPGMILRHNDGTQYVVVEMGESWSTHKNSVRVAPIGGNSWDYKWRAVSTMVADHEAMLTDADGKALPIINEIVGSDDFVPSGMLLSKTFKQGYYQTDPATGVTDYKKHRIKEVTRYYVVAPEGTVYNIDGTVAPYNAIGPGQPIMRIGYIDKDHTGTDGKTLTVSVQPHHEQQIGQVQYAVIHDPNEPANVPLAKKAAPAEDFDLLKTLGVDPISAPAPSPTPTSAPGDTPVPTEDVTPNAAPAPDIPVPTDALPEFAGKNPQGAEMPHPPVSSSTEAVPTYKPSAGPATLDQVGLPGAHSVVDAISQTLDVAKSNQKTGEKKWVTTYGMADGDHIEDMLVQSQTVRDAKGDEFVEVRFRLAHGTRNEVNQTFFTSSTNQTGDWKHAGRNATNLEPGDLIAVRISGGGGATVKGGLRPDGGLKDGPKTPNAQVTAKPVLIGKNAAGTFDVYRTQVMTANGDIGYIDVEDRSAVEPESLYVSTWDPTKVRITTNNKALNPNAQAEGWSVKSSKLDWDRAASGSNVSELNADGTKKLGGAHSVSGGSGWTIQRDYDGAHVELRTAVQTGDFANSLDGYVTIRVKADDPDAHRKVADAMELVGVDREAQKPPDRDALMKLAADKVYEQFHSKYTPGMTAPSMDAALAAIDSAVGKELGRKATIDDITLHTAPDGRVQVLVSEDVSRAVVKRNGIKAYQHGFSGGVSGPGFNSAVLGGLKGENTGIMSTTERWQAGLFFYGMSSVSDHANDAANNVFMRMTNSSSIGSGHAVLDAAQVHRSTGFYWRPNDTFGKRQSDNLNWLHSASASGGNEIMLKRRVGPEMMSHVVVNSTEKAKLIKDLNAAGITKAPNGKSLDDFFVLQGGTQHLDKSALPPLPGTETPLSAIPTGGIV
jgi:hypothetical protein